MTPRWPPAPLAGADGTGDAVGDADGLAAVLRPLGEARMLPADAYTSADVLAWERRYLFGGTWTCLGRASELFDGVRQVGATAGDIPVLLVGGDPVRAFANTCRHRGHELLADGRSSDRAVVVCPYHAWVYGLDGRLRGAPGFRDVAGFRPAEHGLVELPACTWQGWVFVNGTGDAAPFERYVGAMAALVEPYAAETLREVAVHDYDVLANWKVIVENYHECYHCPHIHPELCAVSPPASGHNYDLPGAWVGGAMDLREHADTMSMDGRSNGAFLPGAQRRRVLYLSMLPNLLLSLQPDYVMTHLLTPAAAGRTRVRCSWYAPAGAGDLGPAIRFWDLTNRQDWAACESVQRGLGSPHYRPGPFAPTEDAVHQWVGIIGRAYRGSRPGD